jgi:CDP-6-deoxy-D-xylo-4-hexulose-3-dehydrase
MKTHGIKWPLMSNNLSRSDLNSVIKLLENDDPKLTNGPAVKEFEEQWSRWLGVKYSVMLNSGASANDLTMLALREITGTGEVIVPALTWVSDIASVINAGHKPIFVDIDPKTLGMDADLILNSITPKTKAVFLTHVLGFNALSDKLLLELAKRDVILIEDVCESHGAKHNDQKVGTFGWASNFSFYYAHHMTTIEGGMISTNDFNLYEMLRIMRSHGMVREASLDKTRNFYAQKHPDLNPDFIFLYPSHNMRSTEINATLGLSQLKSLDKNISLRKANFGEFLKSIEGGVFRTDFNIEGNSNYAFTLVMKNPDFVLRDKIENVLNMKGIEFRRGLAGGGNQLRQPYLKTIEGVPTPDSLPNVDFIHHFSWYIGNYPNINSEIYIELKDLVERLKLA